MRIHSAGMYLLLSFAQTASVSGSPLSPAPCSRADAPYYDQTCEGAHGPGFCCDPKYRDIEGQCEGWLAQDDHLQTCYYKCHGFGWDNQTQQCTDYLGTANPHWALPNVVRGWNTSVGTTEEREEAARFFHTNVTDDAFLWSHNVMTPFVGKTLRMTNIDIEVRNAFNTLIELAVKTGTVLWTVTKGPVPAVCGDWVEHINGAYTGRAKTAGFVNHDTWIENDAKNLRGRAVANDWGIVKGSATDTQVVMKYWSYKKAKFTMTWELQELQ